MKVKKKMDFYSNLIKYISINTNLDLTEISFLIKNTFQCRLYKKGTYFAKQGQLSDKIGFNIDGIFVMQVIREDGSEYIKSFIQQNEFILATFNEIEPNPISIQAVSDSEILEAKYSDVKALFEKYPDLASIYRKEVEKAIEVIYLRLEQIATLNAKERYALFQKEFSELEDLIPQYLIASYLGITPTQLSRIRKSINKCK